MPLTSEDWGERAFQVRDPNGGCAPTSRSGSGCRGVPVAWLVMTSSPGPEQPIRLNPAAEQALRAFSAQLSNIDLLGERTRQQLAAAGALQSQRVTEAVTRSLIPQMPAVLAANRLAEQTALAAAAPALEALRTHMASMEGVNRAVAQMQAATAAQNNTVFQAIERLRQPINQKLTQVDFSKLLDEREEEVLEDLLEAEEFRDTVAEAVESEAMRELADEVDRLGATELEALRDTVVAAAVEGIGEEGSGSASGPSAAQIARVIVALYLGVTLLVISFDVPGGADVVEKIANAVTLACIEPVLAAVRRR